MTTPRSAIDNWPEQKAAMEAELRADMARTVADHAKWHPCEHEDTCTMSPRCPHYGSCTIAAALRGRR